MKIKSKAAVTTVAAKKASAAAKGAATVAKKAPAKAAERRVTFTVRADAGKAVYLAGCFNQWNPTGKKMTDKKKDGVYWRLVRRSREHGRRQERLRHAQQRDHGQVRDPRHTTASCGIVASENRPISPARLVGLFSSFHPQVAAIHPTIASGATPAARNDSMRVSPWRLASLRPSGPTTSGTWQYVGGSRPSAR